MTPNPPLFSSLSILNILLISGSFFVMIVGIGQLFSPGKKAVTYVSSALGFSFGLAVLNYLIQSLGFYQNWTWCLYLHYPIELFIGTLLFFFFTLLVEENFPLVSPYLLLFIPDLIATGLLMFYYLKEPSVKLAQMPIYNTDDPFFGPVYAFIAHNLESWVIANIALFIIRTAVALKRKRLVWKPESRSALVFAILLALIMFFGVWVNFFPSEFARKLALFTIIMLVYPLYFFQQKNPHIFGLSVKEEEPQSYQRSTKLVGMDVARILERLDYLMTVEKRYRDNLLTLPKLSGELGLSPHQLSEILNTKLELNFRQYLNRFRVLSAVECLRQDSKRTILEIAFDCGFGSKSAFNTAFLQEMGTTPSAWLSKGKAGTGESMRSD